jgi:hypothetical protein
MVRTGVAGGEGSTGREGSGFGDRRARDLLRWRKRRYSCEECERTFTETHPAPPSRQRVSARFRAHLFERCQGGGAHAEVARDERTSRYQVGRAFEVAGDELVARRETGRRDDSRWKRRITAVVASSRRSSLTSIAGG